MKREYISPAVKAYTITPSAIICGSLDETPVDNTHIHQSRYRGNIFNTIGDSNNEDW